MINQHNATAPPEPVHMRHPVYGAKLVEFDQCEQHIYLGYTILHSPMYLYHADCPNGDLFCSTQVDQLMTAGWVDSPAKIGCEPPEADDDTILLAAFKLLETTGLSQTALMAEIGMKNSVKNRRTFRHVYEAILIAQKGKITKMAMRWFWRDIADEKSYGFKKGKKPTLEWVKP